MMAAFMMSIKVVGVSAARISNIIYAPAPMIGGIKAPPELAAASIPPDTDRLKPELLISGIVNVPVVAVFATALPDKEPINPLEITATFAGPPGLL